MGGGPSTVWNGDNEKRKEECQVERQYAGDC